jgi:molecular chaperone GrpE
VSEHDEDARPDLTDGTAAGAGPDVGDATSADPAASLAVDLEAMVASDPRDRLELITELVEAERQRDEFLDDLRRSHADFENYRRRVVRDGAVQREQGRADVLASLLEVLDDLDRTLAATAGSDDAVAHGVGLVATKLAGALGVFGLERIDMAGVAFDPTLHEAVRQDGGASEPHVTEVLRPGYRVGERVLRAAMVVVG